MCAAPAPNSGSERAVLMPRRAHLCTPACGLREDPPGSAVFRCPATGQAHVCGREHCGAGEVRGASVVCIITDRLLFDLPAVSSLARAARTLKPPRAMARHATSLEPSAADVATIGQVLLGILASEARLQITQLELQRHVDAVLRRYRDAVFCMDPRAGVVHTTQHALLRAAPGARAPGTADGAGEGGDASVESTMRIPSIASLLVPIAGVAGASGASGPAPGAPFVQRVYGWLVQFIARAWARFTRCRNAIVFAIHTERIAIREHNAANIMHKLDINQFTIQLVLASCHGVYSVRTERELVSRLPWLVVFGPSHSQLASLCDAGKRRTKMHLDATLNLMDALHADGLLETNPSLTWQVLWDVDEAALRAPEAVSRIHASAAYVRDTTFPGDLHHEIVSQTHVCIASMSRVVFPAPPYYIARYEFAGLAGVSMPPKILATTMPRAYETRYWRVRAIYGPYASQRDASYAISIYEMTRPDKRGDHVFFTHDACRVWK